METEPIIIVCEKCGSSKVERDAVACWDCKTQSWVLQAVFDQGYCDFCGGEARLTEISIKDWDEVGNT